MSESGPKKLYFYTCHDCGCRFQGGKGSKRCMSCKAAHERDLHAKNREADRIRTRIRRARRDHHNDALRADVASADAAGLSYGVWRSRQG